MIYEHCGMQCSAEHVEHECVRLWNAIVSIMREKQCIFQLSIAIAEHVETKHGWMSELACMEIPIQIEDSS